MEVKLNADEMILSRFKELVELGRKVLATRRKPSPGHLTSDFVDVQLANQWLTSTVNLIGGVFGEDGAHYERLKVQFVEYLKWPNVVQAFGVLLAAQDDFEHNTLFSFRQLIEAELFDDFLEQAEQLLAADYYQPAAVVTGVVLEDGLKKLCRLNEVELPDRPILHRMNSELAKGGVYNKLVQKKIIALADIRNNAAHGNWDEFSKDDVISMIAQTRDFMAKYFP